MFFVKPEISSREKDQTLIGEVGADYIFAGASSEEIRSFYKRNVSHKMCTQKTKHLFA